MKLLDGEIELKAENLGYLIRNLESDEQALKFEIDRLILAKSRANNKVKWLKSYLVDNMKLMEKSEINTPLFKFRVQKNAPSLKVDDYMLPKEYLKVKYISEVDKEKIREDLKAGKEIPGAKFYQGEHLRMK
jgi:hypothetical protein